MSQTNTTYISSSLNLLPPPILVQSNFHDGISTNCYYNLLDVRSYRKEYVPFQVLHMLKSLILHSWIIVAESVKSGIVSRGGNADIFQQVL